MFKYFFQKTKSFLCTFVNTKQSRDSVASTNQWQDVDYYIKPNKRIYVIGDVHGCDALLENTLNKMTTDALNHPNSKLVFVGLGDYVDRGPNSKRVIELLLNNIPDNFETIFLKGNHELYMVDFIEQPVESKLWLDYGGRETLASYDVKPPEDTKTDLKRAALELETNMPSDHLRFLKNLETHCVIDDYFFVHAGIDPDFLLDEQSEMALTSIRAKFIHYTGHFQGKKIIHGHTPVENPDFKDHRINLDTGAYLTGNLTLAVIENNIVTVL
ncbi:MAG: serine/threonine protein phosphatase 1 [Alphaproteobacteria bacterium]|jgi:serine/threonine protein phosphatase 1